MKPKSSERIRATDSMDGGYVPDYEDLMIVLDDLAEQIKTLQEQHPNLLKP